MGLVQLLQAGIVMVINQKFFISGFKGLLHRCLLYTSPAPSWMHWLTTKHPD